MIKEDGLYHFLEEKVEQYNCTSFIEEDPISIPHRFGKKQDIEIAGFFAATLAWGQRKTIINKCSELMHLMDDSPYQYICDHTSHDLKRLTNFKHRTYNSTDLLYFVHYLNQHYQKHTSLEAAFTNGNNTKERLENFHRKFFDSQYAPSRTQKHVATPNRNSACKRINMFLRWMVRQDDKGVDFGLWQKLSPADLMCPLDVHVGRSARKLSLLKRKQDDWTATDELTASLRAYSLQDPVRYDFALFGLGVVEKY